MSRRIMKNNEYSFNEVSIFVEKNTIKSLAKLARKHNSLTHSQCLKDIANIFCAVNQSFADYWEKGIFDITLEEAIKNHPDIVTQRFKAVAKYCNTNFTHIQKITRTHMYSSISE